MLNSVKGKQFYKRRIRQYVTFSPLRSFKTISVRPPSRDCFRGFQYQKTPITHIITSSNHYHVDLYRFEPPSSWDVHLVSKACNRNSMEDLETHSPSSRYSSPNKGIRSYGLNRKYRNTDLPIALKLCKDSRNTVKIYYKQRFGTRLHPASIYFNFELDTIYLDSQWFKHEYDLSRKPVSHFLDNLTEEEKAEIKYLTLDDEFWISEYFEETDDAAFKALRAGVESIPGI